MAGEVPDASLRGTRTTAAASNSLSAAMARAAWRMAHARHWPKIYVHNLPSESPDFNDEPAWLGWAAQNGPIASMLSWRMRPKR